MVSLGCAKNLVDTERLMKQMEANHFTLIPDPSENDRIDVIIINTCGFIMDAKQESIDTILHFVRAKESGLVKKIFVMGCLTQRYGTRLAHEIPEVDGFFGIADYEKIISQLGGNYKFELIGERRILTPTHYAYLKIAEGCNRECSFCVIPSIRGKHVSRSMNEILIEAHKLVDSGVKELILISQDTTYYGLDLNKKRQLPELLKKLSGIPGFEWIRIHYTFPSGFPMDILQIIKHAPNICQYIDIPLQHASTRILKSMKRNMTLERSSELISKIREVLPEAAIRTTFIVGYPGETDKEYEELEQFVKNSKFERMGVFTYSHEEGSGAYKLKDNVPAKVKEERAAKLMHIQEEISFCSNIKKVGKIMKVVIDAVENEYYIGRSEFDSPEIDNEILIKKSNRTLQIGNFYQVKIIHAGNFELFAELI